MSFSATRLTCYALLSSLEEDFRDEIATHAAQYDPNHALGTVRSAQVQTRRPANSRSKPVESLIEVLPYLDFADSYQILLRYKSSLPDDLRVQIESLTPWLDRLIAVRNRVAHTRPLEIDDLPNVVDVCRSLANTAGVRWPGVRNTLARLEADSAYVLGLTINLPSDLDQAPQNNLPVPDYDETGFFGRQQQIQRIKRAIKGAYPVVSILGEGGVGKTAIALKAAYELLDEARPTFDVFVWVTAKAIILTTSEIVRINNAIQDSLQLFESAASTMVAVDSGSDPMEQVLAYMEHFRVLLILDNLETVLDQRLRQFLLDLPTGSKVLVTSRIGLGIENPVQLEPLSNDEAGRLLRALARIRQVRLLESMSEDAILRLASQMSGHPAYIKWFVAGVQSGRRPEELLADNQLLLEFCMSNVYEYLGEDSRAVLRSMQALPGSRGQAELAFINDFSATRIQAALLELLTTNFVQMQSRTPTQPFDTTYTLTDFGRMYLDNTHSVSAEERLWLHNRDDQLRALGATLYEENSSNPFDPATVEVRGVGDFHVAKVLRDAIRLAYDGLFDKALLECKEAQLLSPTYHEAWRVEALVQVLRGDHSAALTAFERASEVSPESVTLAYFHGSYLLNTVGQAAAALPILQRAAKGSQTNPTVLLEIAQAHLFLRNFGDCISTARHVLTKKVLSAIDSDSALTLAARAGTLGARSLLTSGNELAGLELIESVMSVCGSASVGPHSEVLDRFLQLESLCLDLSRIGSERFVRSKASDFASTLRTRVLSINSAYATRCEGRVASVNREKGYGFVNGGAPRVAHFFHVRDLIVSSDWSSLLAGANVMLTPNPTHSRGPRAEYLRLID
jgi:LuxR family transcriptional regulator, glucitol operon activator